MSQMSDYLENALLNEVFRNVGYAPVATVYVELYTATPNDAGGGTPVSGGSYARTAVTFGAASAGSINNSADVTFPTASADWGTVTSFGVFDASSAGNLLVWGPLVSNKTVSNGDIFKFLAGQLVINFL